MGLSLLAKVFLFSLSATNFVFASATQDGDVKAKTKISRQHLMEMSSVGYDKLKDKFMSLDSAVETTVDGSDVYCEVREPREYLTPGFPSKVSQRGTAPLHFYSNILPGDRVTAQNVEEADVFWIGDDNNRNGKTESHSKTIEPHPAFGACLHFHLQDKARNLRFKFQQKAETAFSFGVGFRRGTRDRYGMVDFTAAMEIRTYVDRSQALPLCKTYAAFCLNVEEIDGKVVCKDGVWKQGHSIIAELNYNIAFKEYFSWQTIPEVEKHDVDALRGLLSDIDQNGIPDQKSYSQNLAKKYAY